MSAIREYARALLRESRVAVLARRGLFFFVLPLMAAVAVAVLFPCDVEIADWISRDGKGFLGFVARRYTHYADFRLTLELFLAFWLVGMWKRREDWKRLGLAILLSAAIAGALDTSIRALTGRPRPSAHLPDRFTGPQLRDHRLQSFPSGHSATAMATAGVVAVALPEVGIPFFLFSLGVPWGRFYQHEHYASDVIVGSLIGLWFGLALGWGWRRTTPTTSSL